MATNSPICVICADKTDKVILFTNDILVKSQEVLRARVNNKLKYRDVQLPIEVNATHGYHASCYRIFTAIGKKYFTRQICSADSALVLLPAQTSSIVEKSIDLLPTASTSEIASCNTTDDAVVSTSPVPSIVIESSNNSLISEKPSGASTSTVLSSSIVDEQYNVAISQTSPIVTRTSDALSPMSAQLPGTSTSVQSITLDSSIDNSRRLCIFCNNNFKTVSGVKQKLIAVSTKHFVENLQHCASDLGDADMLNKLQDKSLVYHSICERAYQNNYKSVTHKGKIDWHKSREIRNSVIEEIHSLIEDSVIKNSRSFMLSSLCNIYNTNIKKLCADQAVAFGLDIEPRHFEASVLKPLINDKKIKIIIKNKKKIVVPYHGFILSDDEFANLATEDLLQKAAMILRERILKIQKNKLPRKLYATDLIAGECTVPSELEDFFQTLLAGPGKKRRKNSADCLRKSKSFAEDVIYAIHNGTMKTAKHITLGMTIKSLTNSRTVINILNRYGHICSYNTLESFETEATITSVERSKICPDDIILAPHLCTGVAFNNFDRFVDTRTGKDTLHDTVGIIYQNIDDENEYTGNRSFEDEPRSYEIGNKRRRTLDAITPELEPYAKKPRMTDPLLPMTDDRHFIMPIDEEENAKRLDYVWMLSHAEGISETPMWVGFNSKIIDDCSVQQKVSYLTPIILSPTELAVILETMLQSQKIAKECKQRYMQVTYDLAIAKCALEIQVTEKPRFDGLFIHLGGFHVMLAYFKAIGKYVDECGLSYMMITSNLLASGSINGFITGKHFNRCKRLHPLMALAFQILHWKAFLARENIEIGEDIKEELQKYQDKGISIEDEGSLTAQLVQKYRDYEEATMIGAHGKTAQFYLTYVQLVSYYLMFTRSIRSGNFSLYVSTLPKLANLFFVFNQPNYARWLVKYHDNLLRIDETHPGLRTDFENGFFGIKRTGKPFSRQPVDIILEQTINADAGKRLAGIAHFSDSIGARQRWARSHGIRTSIISHTCDQAGLQKIQDISADLEPRRISLSSQQLHEFVDVIQKNVNPFSSELDNNSLYNIATGKAASRPVSDFLLNVQKTGEQQRETFITECAVDASRFSKALKRNKLLNFPVMAEKKKVKIAGKVHELQMQRDLFGRMVGLSMQQKIDVAKILSYPITPVPMSLCHFDGKICKTNKSALIKLLADKITDKVKSSAHYDVVVIDGFFLVHTIKDVPKTFGKISLKILQMITRYNAKRIDIIFDRYFTSSIKGIERSRRDEYSTTEYMISGPDQARGVEFSKELSNIKFKEALVKFLSTHWASAEAIPFIERKVINLNFDLCYRFEVINGAVVRTTDDLLECEGHEEADTKIVYHICKLHTDSRVLIKANDTDILIIMLGNMKHLESDSQIWMQSGTGNNIREIDITKLYSILGDSVSQALPGLHALTGCDYNPAFFRKGKNKPFKVLLKSEEYQKAFIQLGASMSSSQRSAVFQTLEQFVCHMYNVEHVKEVNVARYEFFSKAYQTADCENEHFHLKCKNFDATCIPPCQTELEQHLRRSHYITNIWRNAHIKYPTCLNPDRHGWIKNGDKLDFCWFEGEQLPQLISDVVIAEGDATEEKDDDREIYRDSEGDEDDEGEEILYVDESSNL